MHFYFCCPSVCLTKRQNETRKRTHTTQTHNGFIMYILCWILYTHYESDFKFLLIVVMSWYWCNFLTLCERVCVCVYLCLPICHCCNDIVLIKRLLWLYPLCGVCTFLFNFLQGLFMIVLPLFSILIGRLCVSRLSHCVCIVFLCVCKCHHGYCFVVTFVKYASKKSTITTTVYVCCVYSREWE